MNTRSLLLLLASVVVVLANHFDYAVICWKLTSGDANSDRTYQFTIYEGFQRKWPSWPSPPTVGVILDTSQSDFSIFPMGGAVPNPAIKQHLDLIAISDEEQGSDDEQWVIGKKVYSLTTSGSSTLNWRWRYDDNARRADLLDNNGQPNGGNAIPYSFTGVMNRFDTQSVCAVPGIPYILLDLQAPNTLIVPVNNDFNRTLSFTISKISESSLVTPYPTNPPQPAGQNGLVTVTDSSKPEFRLNTNTGEFTWQPQVAGWYAIQFMIEVVCDASQGTTCTDSVNQPNCCSRTIWDILLRVVLPDATAPSFITPFDQDATDPLDRTLFVPEGKAYVKTICVDKASATIFSSELPPGATLTPDAAVPGQTCYDLTWPNPTSDAYVCFGASVGTGATFTINHGQYCIKFIVRRKVNLKVYNLPITDKTTDLTPETLWYAFPSTPATPHADILQIRVNTSVPTTATFELWGKFEPYLTPTNPFKLWGTAQVTKVTTIVDGTVDMLVYTLPWGVPKIGNWQMIVNASADDHHQKASLTFDLNFHYFTDDGRWLTPSGINTGKTFYFYNSTYGALYGYSALGGAFWGWTAGHGAQLHCPYNQIINPNSAAAHTWYEFVGSPVMDAPSTINHPGGSGLPYINIKQFAILTLVDGTVAAPATIGPGNAAFARVFARYCIDPNFFPTFP